MEHLYLREQLCFPLYAASRMVTKRYTPLLEKLNLTYPQYLCLLVLWEHEPVTVGEIGRRLLLSSNTLTPLLKKLEVKDYIKRERSSEDERTVEIHLTNPGRELKAEAEKVPQALIDDLDMPVDRLLDLREKLWAFLVEIESLPEKS